MVLIWFHLTSEVKLVDMPCVVTPKVTRSLAIKQGHKQQDFIRKWKPKFIIILKKTSLKTSV